jgi:hypothetical protein
MMTEDETRQRDDVLRAYFAARNWDNDPFFELQREVVLRSGELLGAWPFVVDHLWRLEPTRPGYGHLVFADGIGGFATVEVLPEGSGPMRAVKEQAVRNATHIARRHAGRVHAWVYSETRPDALQLAGTVEPT